MFPNGSRMGIVVVSMKLNTQDFVTWVDNAIVFVELLLRACGVGFAESLLR